MSECMPAPQKMAEWLILAFTRCWTLRVMVHAAGLPCETEADVQRLSQEYPFLPTEAWRYFTRGGGGAVRATIASEWPKLFTFLDRHRGDPEKLLSVTKKVSELRYLAKRRQGALSAADRRELDRDKHELRRVTTANRAARAQQMSNQRGAWNVCKK